MVLNYVFTMYKWWSLEKRSDKKWSWILVLMQVWQQWRAMKIIYLFLKKDARAPKKKKVLLKELSSIESFFESVPAILIMTCIWVHAIQKASPEFWRIEFHETAVSKFPLAMEIFRQKSDYFCIPQLETSKLYYLSCNASYRVMIHHLSSGLD